MGLLDRFEQSMERLLEGATGSLFRQKLQPAEIGKKLERAMLSQQRASVGTRLVPNAYVVRLHPKDYAQFEAFANGLSRQMESWLAHVASRRELTVLDRISVKLIEDPSTQQRNPRIDASITDQSSRKAAEERPERIRTGDPHRRQRLPLMDRERIDATSVFNIPTTPRSQIAPVQLRAISGSFTGQAFPVREGTLTIGRSPDNTIVLNAPDVSRRHARLERTGGHLRLYDLNSTNGTRVNGETVHISDLQPGDEIRLGAQTLSVVTDDNPDPDKQGRW